MKWAEARLKSRDVICILSKPLEGEGEIVSPDIPISYVCINILPMKLRENDDGISWGIYIKQSLCILGWNNRKSSVSYENPRSRPKNVISEREKYALSRLGGDH